MTTSSMNIKTRTKSGGTIYLRNSDIKRPKLRSIDILEGNSGQATTGSITDGIAWALVSKERFLALDGSAKAGEKIALSHFFNSATQCEEVTSVQCPQVSLSSSIQALAQQQAQIQHSNEENHRQLLELARQQGEVQRDHERRMVEELQNIRSEIAQLLNRPTPLNTDIRGLSEDTQKQKRGAGG